MPGVPVSGGRFPTAPAHHSGETAISKNGKRHLARSDSGAWLPARRNSQAAELRLLTALADDERAGVLAPRQGSRLRCPPATWIQDRVARHSRFIAESRLLHARLRVHRPNRTTMQTERRFQVLACDVAAPTFAHTWPTLRPGASRRHVLPSRSAGATDAPSCAEDFAEHWGETGGTLGVKDREIRVRMGK
jgi:hypothetical protein